MQAQCHHRDKYKEIAAKMYFHFAAISLYILTI